MLPTLLVFCTLRAGCTDWPLPAPLTLRTFTLRYGSAYRPLVGGLATVVESTSPGEHTRASKDVWVLKATSGEPDQRLLPYLASGAASCFATDFTVSGSCQDDFTTDEPAIATAHGNWGGAYPPYFYGLLSFFTGRTSRRPS